jgi:hypothetical protein
MLHHRRRRRASSKSFVELFIERSRAVSANMTIRAADRYSPEHAGLEASRDRCGTARRNYLTIAC